MTPSRLPARIQAGVRRAAAGARARCAAACGAARCTRSFAWTATRVARIIEIAARSIGGLCSRTLRFGTGMSLEELILRHALGLGCPAGRAGDRPAGVMMIPNRIRCHLVAAPATAYPVN